MTPHNVAYYEYNFDPKSIRRRYRGPTPATWTRHQFFVEALYSDVEWPLNEWLHNNIHGRWTFNRITGLDGTLIVIGFEHLNDAIMFRLMDGETAWREERDDSF